MSHIHLEADLNIIVCIKCDAYDQLEKSVCVCAFDYCLNLVFLSL